MTTFRISYQNASDKVIRNKHARIKANTQAEAIAIVQGYGEMIAIYKVETI
jgi:hypothetical protein